MGRKWGQLGYSRGQVRYTISQYEQNAMHGFFKNGVPKLMKRINYQIFKIIPPIAFTYMVIAWGKETNQKDSRKKAADFAQET